MIAIELLFVAALCDESMSGLTCTCVPRAPLTSASAITATAASHTDVFEGTVIAITFQQDSAPVPGGRPFSWTDVLATIAVGRSWKGAAADTVVVRTPRDTTMCGFDFTEGHRYLVFARRDPEGRLLTDKCGPTIRWGAAAEQRAQWLGPPGRGP